MNSNCFLLLLLTFTSMFALPCTNTQQLHEGQCVDKHKSKSCMHDHPQITPSYKSTIIHQLYHITITLNNTQCLVYQVYQTENDYRIDSSRLQMEQLDRRDSVITLSLTLDDLESRSCLSYNLGTELIYECSYELVFLEHEQELAHQYFNIRFLLNTDLKSRAPDEIEITSFDVSRSTSPQIKLDSRLYFCLDESCKLLRSSPHHSLYLNGDMYLKHQVSSDDILSDSILVLQGVGYTSRLNEKQIQIIGKFGGYNIYKLKVPVVTENLYITAISKINQTSIVARLECGQVHATKNQASMYDLNQVDYHPNQVQDSFLSKVLSYVI